MHACTTRCSCTTPAVHASVLPPPPAPPTPPPSSLPLAPSVPTPPPAALLGPSLPPSGLMPGLAVWIAGEHVHIDEVCSWLMHVGLQCKMVRSRGAK